MACPNQQQWKEAYLKPVEVLLTWPPTKSAKNLFTQILHDSPDSRIYPGRFV